MRLPPWKSEDKLLQEALDDLAAGKPMTEVLQDFERRYPAQVDHLRTSLQAAGWLAERKEALAPEPAFLQAAQKRLLSDLRQHTTPRQRAGRRFAFGLSRVGMAFQTVLLVLLAFLLLNIPFQLFQSSRNALPGDQLYPLKRLQEQIRLALNVNPLAEALLEVRFTQQRLAELQEMILDGRLEDLEPAVAGYQAQLQRAEQAIAAVGRSDPQLADSMRQILVKSIRDQDMVFSFLLSALPRSLRLGLEQALLLPSQ